MKLRFWQHVRDNRAQALKAVERLRRESERRKRPRYNDDNDRDFAVGE